ncbi:MAG: MBL fold metallo-hydrolase [Lachnospiraceae bacterium]|nr:MBL fold metallo-hydrolase [Lachnospiraceae bacterium]
MSRTWYRQGSSLLQEIKETAVGTDEVAFWYLGQLGYVMKGQVTIYVDVMINDHLNEDGTSARWYQPPFSPEEAKADYVICSHNHIDHLAEPTVKGMAAVNPSAKFIVPAGCACVLKDLGIDDAHIIPVNAGATLELPGLAIRTVQTAHPEYAKDEEGNDVSLAFQLEMNGIRLLHPGDTYLTRRLIDELSQLPKPDIFFPPINGQDFFRTERDCIGNLNIIEAAKLSEILDVDLTIPSHFDMFIGNTVDPMEFGRYFMELRPCAKWHVPALGERFIYRK